jgi:prefoldin subunit 5
LEVFFGALVIHLTLKQQEDVDQYMKDQGGETPNAEAVIRKLDEQHGKYRFMEANLVGKKKRLKRQIPDIKASLDVLKLIRCRKEAEQEMESNFLLSDEVYMKARIPPTDKINLWLGANVMLEYTIDEADALLSKNLESANKNLAQIDIDLDYLRDQITTTEVNMARVFNWDVKRRQQDKLKSSA